MLSFSLFFRVAGDVAKRGSIDAPGARRLSRSSSITVPTSKLKLRSERPIIPLKEENPETSYNFKEEIGR